MSRRRGIGVMAVVVGVVLLGLGWGGLAAAKGKAPAIPTIDQILGTWSVTASHVEYDLTTGAQQSIKATGKYTITDIDEETVNIHFAGSGESWDRSAYYAGGIICAGASDDVTFGDWADIDLVMLSGKSGKLTGTGQFIGYDVYGGYLVDGTIAIKQTGK